jgi:hypothetical protein
MSVPALSSRSLKCRNVEDVGISPANSCPLWNIQVRVSRNAPTCASVGAHTGARRDRTSTPTPMITPTARIASTSHDHVSKTVDSGSEARIVDPAATKVRWRRWFTPSPPS